MSSADTVLFDLDDTLFDHLHAASSGLASIQRHLPRFVDRPFRDLETEYSTLLEEIHQRVLSGELDIDRARHIRMTKLMSADGITPSEANASEVSRLFRESYQNNRRYVEGTRELLEELRERNITIGIVTNNQKAEQEEKLAHLGLDTLVDFMITSEEVGIPKPDPHIFHIALDIAESHPEQAVMVGDSWASDITGARNAGIRAVWYNPKSIPQPEPLDVAEIRSLLPTEEIVRKILA